MTGNPRRHLQNKTYPSLSICFSENLNGKKVAICLLTKWFLPCLTIKYQIQKGGGVGCAPAGAGFSLKLYGDVIILPSQSIPSQSWVQGVRSLLSLLAADEDFSMDLLPFDRFVCMCKCTMNCTVAALQPPLPFTHYKKLNEIFQPQFFQLQCSPFIEKKKKKNQYKSTQVPAVRAPATPGREGCWRSQVFWVSCCITRAQRLISCKNSSAPSARHLSTSCRGNREGKIL